MAGKVISSEFVIENYKKMYLARRFEEKAGQMYGMGKIAGFCHLYIGQEAVVAGVYSAIEKTDQVITSYRDHAHALFAGTDPKNIMAELFGKETGVSRGKGGSMHIFDLEHNFFGGHGIVGAQVPIGTGLAFSNKYRKTKDLSVTFFGDGALHQGQVYESFNMASLWKLPVIYIIENNRYAMGTSVARSSSISSLNKRGDAFEITNAKADGMDIFAVKSAMDKAVQHVRSGNGPYLLEVETYRYRGHSVSDPATYRTKSELNDMKENKDPISNLKKYILENNIANDDDLDKIQKEANDIIKEAIEFSNNSKEPDLKELYTDVYKVV
ncbi:MAG: pyruvate dehydrogenase E1 component alpha subunit [Candidatus Deianiraeaceae bacterium]|jgi:pyruvate dehydrogenase E1 component alpha subunit